jgi:branched-chain amino acid transport system permease protein
VSVWDFAKNFDKNIAKALAKTFTKDCAKTLAEICVKSYEQYSKNYAKNPYTMVAALAAIIVLLPLVLPSAFYFRVAALVFINAIAVVGLNLLMGFAGQVSLGHAGFFGIGAYAVALGPLTLGVPPAASMIGGTVLSALLALLVGRPILKLRGYYLAVATLGLGLLIAMVFTNESELTGGPNGMQVPRLVLFGWGAYGAVTWYWIAGITLTIGTLVAVNLIESPTGRAIRAIHDSETASRVLGVDVAQYKLLVFVLSAIYAAIAGSYFALLDGFVTPDTSGFIRSIEFVVMAVLGGLGSILGSIVGAAILVILPQVLTLFHEYEHIVLGLIMIVFMIFLPAGIVPTLARRIAERMS